MFKLGTTKSDHISFLKNCNALLEGHFVLSSGLHSEYYIQCAQIFALPEISKYVCEELIKKLKEEIDVNKIDAVVAPAMGGLIIGYEIARQLNKPSIFCERVNGEFQFRRGFNLENYKNILVTEDVLTTGKSSLETYKLIKSHKANIIAETCLIKRNPKIKELDSTPIISLIDLEFETYPENSLPDHLKNTKITKPGSRFLKS